MLVSVIVPVFNTHLQYLKPCLDSIAAQTVPCEVILVNDKSFFPETNEALSYYAEKYGWTLVQHWRNRGVAAARNTGLKRVKTPYTAICDSDDIWAPDKLEKQLAAIGEKGVCLCGTTIDYRNQTGYPLALKPPFMDGLKTLDTPQDIGVVMDGPNRYHVIGEAKNCEQRVVPKHLFTLLGADAVDGFDEQPLRTAYARLIRFNASLCGSNALFSTRELKREGFDPKLTGADEWDALLNIARDYEVQIAPYSLCTYLRHSGSYSVTQLKNLRAVCEAIIYKHRLQLTDEERVILQSVETTEWATEFERATFHKNTPYKIIQYSG